MKDTDASNPPETYYFFNLGCPKNLVDAERVAARLEAHGWREAAAVEEAGLLVVTTCAFISMAEEESIETILRVASVKGGWQKLAVLGCLVTREGARLRHLIPEVDIFLTVNEMESLPMRLDRGSRGRLVPHANMPASRKLFTPAHIAYLKISEGCSNRCSYCMIPSIRGDLRSLDSERLIREAGELADAGVKELVIVAQDTTAWGGDIASGGGLFSGSKPRNVYDLVERLAASGPPWIRLMYLHPAHVDTERVISLVRSGAIVPYLDVPIQHAADPILERMERGYYRNDLRRMFESLRGALGGVVLRTTVMVGFPGETEADFGTLLQFIEDMSFDHVGVFEYSDEAGTRAAGMDSKVPRDVAVRRRDELIELQMDISQERLERRVGGREIILVDELLGRDERTTDGVWGIGRFYGQSYEIDGITYLSGAAGKPGQLAAGCITGAEVHDLFASLE
jgi:ribosomal protein S12 methylthiotransferase